MRVLLDNEFVRVEELEDRHVLVLRRKAQPAPTAEIPTVYREAIEHTRPEHRTWGLVIDVRAVAGRNDPDFERAMQPVRKMATDTFARVVVLVRSMAGRLQIERTSRGDGTRVLATSDEAEALRFAESGDEDAFW